MGNWVPQSSSRLSDDGPCSHHHYIPPLGPDRTTEPMATMATISQLFSTKRCTHLELQLSTFRPGCENDHYGTQSHLPATTDGHGRSGIHVAYRNRPCRKAHPLWELNAANAAPGSLPAPVHHIPLRRTFGGQGSTERKRRRLGIARGPAEQCPPLCCYAVNTFGRHRP